MSCKHNYIKIKMIGEKFCTKCTPCPKCNKPPANIDEELGVMACDDCSVKLARMSEKKISTWKSNDKLMDYAATPFWKHMGLPPKEHEIKQEKKMKWEGKTYADLHRERNSGKNARFNNGELVKKALKGELPRGRSVDYGRQGPPRE